MTTEICVSCRSGSVTLRRGLGRSFTYRRGFVLEIPEDIEVPTCEHCGAEYIDAALRDVIKARLKDTHDQSQHKHMSFLISVIQERTGASYREIEKACGLTPTYLSHVLSGRREASEQLIALLEAYAVCPSEVGRRLGRVSAHDTKSVKLAIAPSPSASGWENVEVLAYSVAQRKSQVVVVKAA